MTRWTKPSKLTVQSIVWLRMYVTIKHYENKQLLKTAAIAIKRAKQLVNMADTGALISC